MVTCPRCQRALEEGFPFCPYDGAPLGGEAKPLPPKPPSVPPAQRAALAALFDRYNILGVLGLGAMTQVFHAIELESGTEVAIKVMSDARARNSPERQRFYREAELLVRMRHPNIIRVFATGELANGAPYIILEHLYGETLGVALRRGDPVDVALALRIARETAAGLAAAHAEGIVHRDVKPDNIFLAGSLGKLREVKVLDFGLARLYGASGLTASGMIMGTPEYMAPEQTVNDATDARTDVYSLGVVLYRLLSGGLPFGGTEVELLASHLARRPPPLPGGPALPPDLERVVMGALRKLPRNRYPSMQDFGEDLARLAGEGDGEIGGPSSLWEDEYVPQSAFAEAIARILRKKAASMPAPPPPEADA